MGKGRRLTISRSERFLGSYSYGNVNGDRDNGVETELVEEDVWSAVDDEITERPDGDWSPRAGSERHEAIPNGFSRPGRHVGGLSLVFHDPSTYATSTVVHQCRSGTDPSPSPRGRTNMARSAPLNVPDWSKILRVDSVDSLHEDESERVEDDETGENMVPPHEWAARGRNAGGLSVFGGVGRTLKGRDLRRVRDAVWSQTGFDG